MSMQPATDLGVCGNAPGFSSKIHKHRLRYIFRQGMIPVDPS